MSILWIIIINTTSLYNFVFTSIGVISFMGIQVENYLYKYQQYLAYLQLYPPYIVEMLPRKNAAYIEQFRDIHNFFFVALREDNILYGLCMA